MPRISLDVFAATNPAFGAIVLRSFVKSYVAIQGDGAPYSLAFLPLPIVLSWSISRKLERTTINTGWLTWTANNPEIATRLSDRMRDTAQFSRDSLVFGLRYQLLRVDANGTLFSDVRGLQQQPHYLASDERGKAIVLAARIGAWMGQVGSPSTIFYSLGILL